MDKTIYAKFDDKTIRVYQAYNNTIANETLNLGTFGDSFKRDRMTWIKPSFLWMMYRSGWAKKENQERVLAFDISRFGFESILSEAVVTSYDSNTYLGYEDWKAKLDNAKVRCQWDPERDIYGNGLEQRTIQLGLKGDILSEYIKNWMYMHYLIF